ncbi:MAG: protein-L-isoaspartate(D-aspartate) O-methyltransferase [Gemmatimonadetes bacterium]|nr:MAG: protein-L-isoaspartate(D-aspartate) O-methyltransferase [Gemmatimonadota bacterium]
MGSGPLDDHRFVGYRRKLIEEVRAAGVEDLEVLQLLDRVPRHHFLPEGVWPRAYEDAAVPIGYGQTASQPSLQAWALTVLRPGPDDRVLEVGTGGGFMTALLALLADRVYSIERVRELSQRARRALDDLKLTNVALMVGDGTIGWRKYAPFDVIVVSAAAPAVPQPLADQLADGGRMLIPLGSREEQRLMLVEKTGFAVTERPVRDGCQFAPLVGKFGWAPESGEGRTT